MKSATRLLVGLLFLAFAFACFTQPTFAQTNLATIRGTVLDPQGKAIPKATVTARNVATGQERKAGVTSDGIYVLPDLPAGTYDVHVDSAGFSKGIATGIILDVGGIRDINFNLQLASVATEVKVTGEAPLIETTRTDLSSTINDEQIANLPVFNISGFGATFSGLNDYENLATLSPGVRFDATGDSLDVLGPGSYNYRGTLVNIDGGDITDQVVSSRDALGASLDEVKEFQVITNNYLAEYGQAGSVIINVVTKSGTNELHGSAHTFFRGRNLGASNFFYNLSEDANFRRAPFQKDTWGVTSGGPIVKDKTFWFANFEQVNQSTPFSLTPPTGVITVPQADDEILWSAKVDHQLFNNELLTVRYNLQRETFSNLLIQLPTYVTPNSLIPDIIHDNTLTVALISTISSHVVNEARFFWHRYLDALPVPNSDVGVLTANSYTGAPFCCPQGGLQSRFQYIDNLTWTKGTHTFKTGVNISHFPYQSLFQQYHFGEYDTTVDTLTVGLGPAFVSQRDNIYGLYVEDSWKLRPNLTLNYGLRWDYEDGGLLGGTIPKPGGGCFQANGIIPACGSDKRNFQPRVALAWTPRYDSGFLHTLFGGADKSVIRVSFAEITELAYLNINLDSYNFDGVTLLTLSIPYNPSNPADPVYPYLVSSAACAPNPAPCLPPLSILETFATPGFYGRIRPISPNIENPQVFHFGLDFSRQYGNSFVVDVGYLGVIGIDQFGENDTNYPAILPDPLHAGFYYFGNRPNAAFAAIRTQQNTRASNYQGGFISVQKRYGQHYQFQGSYTYSKTLTNTEDFYGPSEPGGSSSGVPNPSCFTCDWGSSQNDIRHVATFSVIMDTNNLMKPSFTSHIVNNWSLGFVGTMHSGAHFPISTGTGPYAGETFAGFGAETQQRASVLPNGDLIATNIASANGSNLSVGPNGAGVCGCPQTTFLAPAGASTSGAVDTFKPTDIVDFQSINGNLARNTSVGDPFVRFDGSLSKTFKIKERVGLEFRVDAINLLNHANFIEFNGNDVLNAFSIIGPAGCHGCIDETTGLYVGFNGHILKASDFQHGRITNNYLGNPYFGMGNPGGAADPRTLQLSFRIKW